MFAFGKTDCFMRSSRAPGLFHNPAFVVRACNDPNSVVHNDRDVCPVLTKAADLSHQSGTL